jgi:hypothetical protein
MDKDAPPDRFEELIEGFMRANSDQLAEDPAWARERLDRFLGKLVNLTEDDRRKIREAVLGKLH